MKARGRIAGLFVTLALFVMPAVLSACGGDGDGDGSETPSVSVKIGAQTVREREGVRLTLTVDRQVYQPDEEVLVTAVVENIVRLPVTYSGAGLEEPVIELTVISELNGEETVGAGDAGMGEPLFRTLDPGDKISREATWDQQLATYQTPVAAPPGEYAVRARIRLGDPAAGEEVIKHSAAVTFTLEGSDPIVGPKAAIEGAMSMDEVRMWAQERGGSLICATTGAGLFYNVNVFTGLAFETFDFVYDAQVLNGDPICSAVTEDDTWRIILSSAQGSEPKRISAFVDLHDGTALSMEEGGPLPVGPLS
jgi:hypothetical protein